MLSWAFSNDPKKCPLSDPLGQSSGLQADKRYGACDNNAVKNRPRKTPPNVKSQTVPESFLLRLNVRRRSVCMNGEKRETDIVKSNSQILQKDKGHR